MEGVITFRQIERVFYPDLMVNSRTPSRWPGQMTHPRHVWVEGSQTPQAGILLMWRQVSAGWEGWVVWADFYAPQESLTVRQGWVPGERIRPVG